MPRPGPRRRRAKRASAAPRRRRAARRWRERLRTTPLLASGASRSASDRRHDGDRPPWPAAVLRRPEPCRRVGPPAFAAVVDAFAHLDATAVALGDEAGPALAAIVHHGLRSFDAVADAAKAVLRRMQLAGRPGHMAHDQHALTVGEARDGAGEAPRETLFERAGRQLGQRLVA